MRSWALNWSARRESPVSLTSDFRLLWVSHFPETRREPVACYSCRRVNGSPFNSSSQDNPSEGPSASPRGHAGAPPQIAALRHARRLALPGRDEGAPLRALAGVRRRGGDRLVGAAPGVPSLPA